VRWEISRAETLSTPGADLLVLAVNLTDDYADVAQVRNQPESLTVAHARQAVDQSHLPIDIRLRPATTTRRAPN